MIRKLYLHILLFITIVLISNLSIGQIDSSKYEIYNTEYEFNSGIYINISQVKNNNPISTSRIITNVSINDIDFYKIVTSEKNIRYFDLNGIEMEIKSDKVWGYCKNNKVYINWKDDYNLIPIFGSACHFVANETISHNTLNDPFYNGRYSNTSYNNRTTTELRQYILDFKKEIVYDFTWQNVETLLTSDITLYKEFTALKKRRKKQMAFIYLRRYNDNNPIYLPKN